MMSQDRIEINHTEEIIEVGISEAVQISTSIIEQYEEIVNIEIEGEESITINLAEYTEDLHIEITEPIEVTNISFENISEEIYVTITEEPTEEEVKIEVIGLDENILINISENSFQVNADFLATEGPAQILNLPTEFPPTRHTHEISDIENLEEVLSKKADLINGKVDVNQLPIPQLGILEFPSFLDLPQPGSAGTLYITSDDDGQYRWKNGMYLSLTQGSDKTYVHEQGTSSAIWHINHNMNKFPSVTIMDNYGTEYDGEIKFIDNNNLTIEFSIPFNGIATLN